jgi:ParB family transcriptional regulator, chromosome partitioning protein
MITNIRIDKIFPHPDNPRKDLGDLTELAASIKANGILQNLTVVASSDPSELWRVVIGHRRLAAAKLAGLSEVPCVISDMDHKTQVATMLLENMQRNDLTIYEQAQGFQMMLNFGDTIDEVAKMTGFSETTIKRRVKLLDLDGEKFKKSVERGATLQDYAELDKIGSVELKNSVLEKIGTSNFKWELQNAVEKENKEKYTAIIVAELVKFAVQVESVTGLQYVNGFYPSQKTEITVPADAGTEKYFFCISSYGHITLYKKPAENEPCISAGPSAEERQQLQERRQQLAELHKRAYDLRGEFVKNYVSRQKAAHKIMEFVLKALLAGDLGDAYDLTNDICKVIGIEISESEDDDDCDDVEVMAEAAVFEAFEASPEKVLLAAAYCGMENDHARYHDWQLKFEPNQILDTLYDALEQLGYEISEEERALRDGTHELYVREEDKDDMSGDPDAT